jgi:23S rRNA (uracil1939-C5)-methyltransferase
MRTVDLTIHDVAFGGAGVARDSGKAVFVPFTIDGERVSARVVREKSNSPRRS